MTLPEAKSLLEKYWNGDTTLEEEAQLREFFQNHSRDSLPPDLQQADGLFSFYERESRRIAPNFALPEEETGKQAQTKSPVKSWLRYAAAFILLLAGISLYLYTKQQSRIDGQASRITQQEQAQAFKTTEKALKLVASNLNKGKSEMQKLAVFARVQQQIAGN